jgi:hypothetical protein
MHGVHGLLTLVYRTVNAVREQSIPCIKTFLKACNVNRNPHHSTCSIKKICILFKYPYSLKAMHLRKLSIEN